MNTRSKSRKIAYAVLGTLTAVGVACWAYQLACGLGVTGMSNANSWGAYIVMFMFFVGLSAGGLIVASSAHVFHIERFKKVSKPAVIVSTVCICMAGMFVLIDLGGFTNVWRILTGPNPTSPLLWDVCVITVYLVINLLDLYWMHAGDERKVDVLSRFALPVAILVHSVTAWIFGLQIAKAWYTAVMAPIFVASAMDSGLALLLLALLALEKMGKIEVGESLMGFLAGLLATCVAVDAYFIGCEVLTMAYPGAHESVALSHMLAGATAPFFWFEVAGGLLAPFCILVFARNRKRKGLVVAASTLVIAGVLCKRIWLLLTSFITPNVEGAAGITLGSQGVIESAGSMWALAGAYAPTPVEIAIIVGVVSLGVLAFLLLSDKLIVAEGA